MWVLTLTWGTPGPSFILAVISDAALPTSIWVTAILNFLPSSESDLVKPVIAVFVAVYGDENGRGA